MNAASLYESIHRDNLASIREGDIFIDTYLGRGVADLRRGISLIIPLRHISVNCEGAIHDFQMLEPGQYYYPVSDLHITVFDFISAHPSYAQSNSLDEAYAAITSEALAAARGFSVAFKGIVFSREAGLFTGYDGGAVVALRERIRGLLLQQGLPNMERYPSKSVHATFFRFAKALANPGAFAEAIEARRAVELGNEEVHDMALVEHDWYNRKNSIRTIKRFALE